MYVWRANTGRFSQGHWAALSLRRTARARSPGRPKGRGLRLRGAGLFVPPNIFFNFFCELNQHCRSSTRVRDTGPIRKAGTLYGTVILINQAWYKLYFHNG